MTKEQAIMTLKKISAVPMMNADQRKKISDLLNIIKTSSEMTKEIEDKVVLANQLKL